MFDHVKFGVSDYAASKAFFLAALEPLGVAVVSEGAPAYGVELCRPQGTVSLCLFQTEDKPAPLHIAFAAENRRQVDAFHRAALAAGERLAARVRATVHASLESRDAIARLAVADTVCPASNGSRTLARGALAWVPGPLSATRLVTVVVRPAFPAARPETTGTVVGCS